MKQFLLIFSSNAARIFLPNSKMFKLTLPKFNYDNHQKYLETSLEVVKNYKMTHFFTKKQKISYYTVIESFLSQIQLHLRASFSGHSILFLSNLKIINSMLVIQYQHKLSEMALDMAIGFSKRVRGTFNHFAFFGEISSKWSLNWAYSHYWLVGRVN